MTLTYRLAALDDIPALEELIPLSARKLQVGFYSETQIEGGEAVGEGHGIFFPSSPTERDRARRM